MYKILHFNLQPVNPYFINILITVMNLQVLLTAICYIVFNIHNLYTQGVPE